MKVVGASAPYSGTPSSSTVRIPTNLKTTVSPSDAESVRGKKISDLNEVAISSGVFNILIPTVSSDAVVGDTKVGELSEVTIKEGDFVVNVNGAQQSITFHVDPLLSMNENIAIWKGEVTKYNNAYDPDVDLDFALTADGKLQVSCSEPMTMNDVSTNFLAQTGITPATLTSSTLNVTKTPIALTVDSQSTMGSNVDKWNQVIKN